MKTVASIVAAISLAIIVAPPADAAKASKHKRSAAPRHATMHRDPGSQFQGGVLKGPLYNGQDYLGDDPDPNIRTFLLRDKGRYGGPD